MERRAVIISVNDTLRPRTGGEYVFRVIKTELLRLGYQTREFSVPNLIRRLKAGLNIGNFDVFLRFFSHMFYSLLSIYERYHDSALVITSASPAFPAFGHIVYHQPKAGMCCSDIEAFLSPYVKLGMSVLENERISPLWLLAKRSYFLHLSNSLFTKRLMKELYDIDSAVLYPPVQLPRCSRWDLKRHRKFSLIIVRPKAISGIMFLPNIVSGLAREVPLIVIGECDVMGLNIIKYLKKRGFNIKYFGFVAKSFKEELFKKASHYLHLGFNESFGITVIETMASGCIPIAPRSGAIPEYLPENLLYSDFDDAAEKLETKLGIDDLKLKIDLRRTAEKFDEHNFREKFCCCVEEVAKIL